MPAPSADEEELLSRSPIRTPYDDLEVESHSSLRSQQVGAVGGSMAEAGSAPAAAGWRCSTDPYGVAHARTVEARWHGGKTVRPAGAH